MKEFSSAMSEHDTFNDCSLFPSPNELLIVGEIIDNALFGDEESKESKFEIESSEITFSASTSYSGTSSKLTSPLCSSCETSSTTSETSEQHQQSYQQSERKRVYYHYDELSRPLLVFLFFSIAFLLLDGFFYKCLFKSSCSCPTSTEPRAPITLCAETPLSSIVEFKLKHLARSLHKSLAVLLPIEHCLENFLENILVKFPQKILSKLQKITNQACRQIVKEWEQLRVVN